MAMAMAVWMLIPDTLDDAADKSPVGCVVSVPTACAAAFLGLALFALLGAG